MKVARIYIVSCSLVSPQVEVESWKEYHLGFLKNLPSGTFLRLVGESRRSRTGASGGPHGGKPPVQWKISRQSLTSLVGWWLYPLALLPVTMKLLSTEIYKGIWRRNFYFMKKSRQLEEYIILKIDNKVIEKRKSA